MALLAFKSLDFFFKKVPDDDRLFMPTFTYNYIVIQSSKGIHTQHNFYDKNL